jgi:hypothetical protein
LGGTGNNVRREGAAVVGGTGNTASGIASFVSSGRNNVASGPYSHVEGDTNTASSAAAHAEGGSTQAVAQYAHAEGNNTSASGGAAHAEGQLTTASSTAAHAEGTATLASGQSSHSEGYFTQAEGSYTHSGGWSEGSTRRVKAVGIGSFNHSVTTTAYTSTAALQGARGEASAILGGYNNTVLSASTASIVLGGSGNTVSSNTTNSAIIGGVSNTVASGLTSVVVLGTSGVTATSSNTVYTNGMGMVRGVRIPSAYPYTLTASDDIVEVDASAPNTVVPPDSLLSAGRTFVIKKIGASDITVDPEGTTQIDSSTTYTLAGTDTAVTVYSNGTAWRTI